MNNQDIAHLAHLSRLHLSDEEIDAYTKQFDEIVGYVDKIKEVAHDDIPQQVRDDNANRLREDEVFSYVQPQSIINEAHSHQDNFVKVKKILNQ